eukprot:scaffold26519_cov101-Isochrysis_galbana.AAC.1
METRSKEMERLLSASGLGGSGAKLVRPSPSTLVDGRRPLRASLLSSRVRASSVGGGGGSGRDTATATSTLESRALGGELLAVVLPAWLPPAARTEAACGISGTGCGEPLAGGTLPTGDIRIRSDALCLACSSRVPGRPLPSMLLSGPKVKRTGELPRPPAELLGPGLRPIDRRELWVSTELSMDLSTSEPARLAGGEPPPTDALESRGDRACASSRPHCACCADGWELRHEPDADRLSFSTSNAKLDRLDWVGPVRAQVLDVRRRADLTVRDRLHERVRWRRLEQLGIGRAARGNVHQQPTEAPHVRLLAVPILPQHLGRHEDGGARHGHRHAGVCAGSAGRQHVARLEVSVEHAVLVQVGHAARHVARDGDKRVVPGGLRLDRPLDELRQREVHQLGQNAVVHHAVRGDANHEQHVGVSQLEHQLTLVHQKLHLALRHLPLAQQLARNLGARVLRLIHVPSGPRSDEIMQRDTVPPDQLEAVPFHLVDRGAVIRRRRRTARPAQARLARATPVSRRGPNWPQAAHAVVSCPAGGPGG